VRTAVVAGAGLLGLEAAHALRELGLAVVALDRGPRLMARQSDERCSELLGSYFAGLGIEVLSGTTASALRTGPDGALAEVVLSDGTAMGAGMYVVCAGITPNIELAQTAGVACNRGVLVNARMETSAIGVYAVGDVAELDGQTPGLWPTAVGQAEVAAANLLGRDERYDPGLQPVILKGVGLDMTSAGSYQEEPGDDVVVIDGPGHEYRKLVVRNGHVVGAILLGRPDDSARVLNAVKRNADVSALVPALRTGDWSVL
jgi:NAD(P)H-nitrite reductase large subunit